MKTKHEAILFVGAQATGKSTFYKHRFFNTHIRINLDMLKTRHREKSLVDCCIKAHQSFVVDNTNPTIADRERYLKLIPREHFDIHCYYFRSSLEEIIGRNAARTGKECVPLPGVLSTYNKLERPTLNEGFDKIFYVYIDEHGHFNTSELIEDDI